MAKKKDSSLGKLLYLGSIVAGVVAIAMIFLTSMKIEGSVFGLSGTTEYSGINVVFGYSTDNAEYIKFSFLNLLPYLFVVGGVILVALKICGISKTKLFDLIAMVLFIAGGALFFFTPNFVVLAESFKNAITIANSIKTIVTMGLGIGAILSGVLSIGAGVIIAVKNFLCK